MIFLSVCYIPSQLNDGILEGCNMLSQSSLTLFIKILNHYCLVIKCMQIYWKKIKHYRNTKVRSIIRTPPLLPKENCG